MRNDLVSGLVLAPPPKQEVLELTPDPMTDLDGLHFWGLNSLTSSAMRIDR